MRFANPEYFWLLLLVPLMAGYLVFLRKGDIPGFRFSSFQKLGASKDSRQFSFNIFFPGALRLGAVLLIIIGLARPQKGLQSEEMTTKATDILLCLDASRSMESIDFKPKNRFEVAKASKLTSSAASSDLNFCFVPKAWDRETSTAIRMVSSLSSVNLFT